jgi:hypothetical protein
LERLRRRFPEGVLAGFIDVVDGSQQRLRRPSFVAGLIAVVFAFVITRGVWAGSLPYVGFSLPPPESAADALGAYAGGWNPAGLGSPEVLRPAIAATAVVQWLLFDHPGGAIGLLTLAAFLSGAVGTNRLLRTWGIGSVAGYVAGIAFMGTSAAAALGAGTHWSSLVALGVLPWPLVLSLSAWPERWLARVGRMAAVTATTGVMAAFSPALLPLPALAIVLWALVGRGPRWAAALRALAGAVLALPLLMPWVLYADLASFYTDGAATFWEPSLLTAGGLAVALVGALLSADTSRAPVAGWGGLLAAIGTLGARAGDFGAGREAGIAGLVAAALGTAVVVGSAIDLGYRRASLSGPRLAAAWVALLAAVLVVLTAVGPTIVGRATLPEDELTDRFSFAVAGDMPTGRVLVFGPAGDLPGTTYEYEGLAYRVFTPPVPDTWDAYLPEPRLGDLALVALFDDLVDGSVRRAGERLAPFGVSWVVFLDPSPLEGLLEAQLDLVPLRSLDVPVFRNEVPAARAVAASGRAWEWDGTGYRIPVGAAASGTVRIAENADYRWGPGTWAQDEWANEITVSGREVSFRPYEPRRTVALLALAWLIVLVVGSAAGRWRR